MDNINKYYDLNRSKESVKNKKHRNLVGGFWDEIGRLQFDYLVKRDLNPDMKLIDIGCGCLRGGIHFVNYLEPHHYFGMDISDDLLDVGYNKEIKKLDLQKKLDRNKLICDFNFSFNLFNENFDFAVAISLFTHLPLNHIRLCLENLATNMKNGSLFCATFFLVDNEQWSKPFTHQPGGATTLPTSDPYHYREIDLRYCIADLPWELEIVGDWRHPRDQKMVVFKKTENK